MTLKNKAVRVLMEHLGDKTGRENASKMVFAEIIGSADLKRAPQAHITELSDLLSMVPTGPHSRAPVATNENLTFAAMTAEYKAEMRQAKADDDYKPKLWDGRRWIPRSWTGPVLEHDDARDLEVRVEGAVGRLSEILGDGMTREDALQYMTGLAANAVENHFRDDDDELAFDGARY